MLSSRPALILEPAFPTLPGMKPTARLAKGPCLVTFESRRWMLATLRMRRWLGSVWWLQKVNGELALCVVAGLWGWESAGLRFERSTLAAKAGMAVSRVLTGRWLNDFGKFEDPSRALPSPLAEQNDWADLCRPSVR